VVEDVRGDGVPQASRMTVARKAYITLSMTVVAEKTGPTVRRR